MLAGCAGPRVLRVDDQLVPVGRETALFARMTSRQMDGSVTGQGAHPVTLFVDDQYVVESQSDAAGYAAVLHTFNRPGDYSLRAQYVTAFGRPITGSGTVFAWPADARILVVDLDGAIADTEPTRVWIDPVKAADPHTQSAEVLRFLAGDFRIVYLTSRPRKLLKKSAAWLAKHGFPRGPVLTQDLAYSESPQTDGLTERLGVIRAQFEHTAVGIANRMNYYDVFQKNALFTILVDHGQKGGAARIEGGVVVRDWLQIRELFTRNPGLNDPTTARALAANSATIALPQ